MRRILQLLTLLIGLLNEATKYGTLLVMLDVKHKAVIHNFRCTGLSWGLEYGDPRKVDHINGNGLNNQRYNLRIVTPQKNRWNSTANSGARSQYKGVNWHWFRSKRCGKWRAQIAVDGKQKHLGLFATEEEAALAYDAAAQCFHGEYARLNFPENVRTGC